MVALALEALGITAEVEIHIEKRLPVQGGLGAGSANAVAALVGLETELGSKGLGTRDEGLADNKNSESGTGGLAGGGRIGQRGGWRLRRRWAPMCRCF